MNKFKTMATAFALICGLTASAQFSTGGSSSSHASSQAEIKDYNQIGVSYVNESFKFDFPEGDDRDNLTGNGFGISYTHGFSVTKKLPIYVETGLRFNFNFASEDNSDKDYGYEAKTKYQHAALSIPINIAYKFNVTDNFAIKPYLGLNFKFNVIMRQKYESSYNQDNDHDWDDDDYWDWDDYSRASSSSEPKAKWKDMFSKKDMDSKDYVWNRFQMGWHVGADFQFSKFYLGVSYGTDFIKAWDWKKYKVNTGTLCVSIGGCF